MQNKVYHYIKYIFLLLTFIFFSESSWAQFTIPSKPDRNMYVYDYVDLLSQQQINHLQNKLYRYEDSTSTQIVIVIIDDLKGEDISMLGTKWAHAWGIGGKEEDNGIFILLQKDSNGPGGQIDIATGYGIEYRMTDRMSKRIINQIVIPNFKQQQYYEGLDQATDAIISILNGEFEGDGIHPDDTEAFWIPLLFLLFIILIIILSKRNHGGSGGSGGMRGPSILDMLILGSMGRSSGGGYTGGGFGGGGFSGGSFGGGGFGGGGASGRW